MSFHKSNRQIYGPKYGSEHGVEDAPASSNVVHSDHRRKVQALSLASLVRKRRQLNLLRTAPAQEGGDMIEMKGKLRLNLNVKDQCSEKDSRTRAKGQPLRATRLDGYVGR